MAKITKIRRSEHPRAKARGFNTPRSNKRIFGTRNCVLKGRTLNPRNFFVKGKRGIFFTFMSILIVSALLFAFTPQSYISLKQKSSVIQSRVDSSDDYVENMKGVYLERALRVATYNGVRSLVWYVNESGYLTLTEVQSYFNEAAIYGTLNSNSITRTDVCDGCIGKDFMVDANLTYSLEKLENASSDFLKIKTIFDKDTMRLELFQDNTTGPWQVGANLMINYTVDAGLVNWTQTNLTVTSRVGIEGMHNPLILRERSQDGGTNGLGRNNGWHDASNISQIVVSELTEYEYDAVSSVKELENMTYRFRYDVAPSFLQRFTDLAGFTPSACCGIEVLINPNKTGYHVPPTATDPDYRDKSYVDWCIYTGECPPSFSTGAVTEFYNITGVSACTVEDDHRYYSFKLDIATMAYYGWETSGTNDPCP